MPDFTQPHKTRTEDGVTRVVAVDPHWRFQAGESEVVIHRGQFWDSTGSHIIEDEAVLAEAVAFVERQTEETQVTMGFKTSTPESELEPERETPTSGTTSTLMDYVAQYKGKEDAYDKKDRLSTKFFSSLMGRRVLRGELNRALAALAENED